MYCNTYSVFSIAKVIFCNFVIISDINLKSAGLVLELKQLIRFIPSVTRGITPPECNAGPVTNEHPS
jgi:hypothetical protein